MSKRKSHLYTTYAKPLPIDLAQLSIKNIIFGFNTDQTEITVVYEDGIFKTANEFSTRQLWFNGFFGKGSLSRSEPTFVQRTKRRLHLLDETEENSFTSEEITRLRREERLDFKLKRAELERLENIYKIAKDAPRLREVEAAKSELTKAQKQKKPVIELYKQFHKPVNVRLEDEILIHDPDFLDDLEYLQLLPCEVLFLSMINRVSVIHNSRPLSFQALVKVVIPSLTANSKELKSFITYYHYKSLGWCVKSGVKFSADFILYQRGPVFNHAEFAVVIPEPDMDWIQMNGIIRVVAGVKKNLVLNYVDTESGAVELESMAKEFEEFVVADDDDDDNEKVRRKFVDFLKLFTVNEVGVNRWSSTRNRE